MLPVTWEIFCNPSVNASECTLRIFDSGRDVFAEVYAHALGSVRVPTCLSHERMQMRVKAGPQLKMHPSHSMKARLALRSRELYAQISPLKQKPTFPDVNASILQKPASTEYFPKDI